MSTLFATKSLERLKAESEGAGEHTLKRTLGASSLIALGIGAIIGAGLFSLTGIAAAQHAGPAVVLSFLVAALGCAFAGLCYSEFSTMIPVAGSAYTYAYATMGELLAWIIGWDLVLEYAVGAATVFISWSAYVVSFLHDRGINLPAQLIASPWQPVQMPDGSTVYGLINLPAVLIVVAISLLLMVGIQESARANAVIVVIKVSVVVVFIGLGIWFIKPGNYEPFIPPNTGTFGEFGWSGIMRAAGVIFFAYIGFDAVSTAAQEAKQPQRDMPIGIIGSLVICTILYVAFAAVMSLGAIATLLVVFAAEMLMIFVQDDDTKERVFLGLRWLAFIGGVGALLWIGGRGVYDGMQNNRLVAPQVLYDQCMAPQTRTVQDRWQECSDGWDSSSIGRRGACSHHGGVVWRMVERKERYQNHDAAYCRSDAAARSWVD